MSLNISFQAYLSGNVCSQGLLVTALRLWSLQRLPTVKCLKVHERVSPRAQQVKNPPAIQETQFQSLGREDPPEEGMAAHSSVLAWEIPWTEEPGGLQSRGSQRVVHNWTQHEKQCQGRKEETDHLPSAYELPQILDILFL